LPVSRRSDSSGRKIVQIGDRIADLRDFQSGHGT